MVVIYVVVGWWIVMGVDEVEVWGEVVLFGVLDRICLGSNVGEVVVGVIVEEGLKIGGGGVRDEVGGDIGDGNVIKVCCLFD